MDIARQAVEATPLAPAAPGRAAAVAALENPPLQRFCRLMARAGLEVDALRMCVDRSYAFERLALAHAGDVGALRQSALDLFATLDRNAAAEPVV
jgi:hypothetical protein